MIPSTVLYPSLIFMSVPAISLSGRLKFTYKWFVMVQLAILSTGKQGKEVRFLGEVNVIVKFTCLIQILINCNKKQDEL